MADEIVNTDGIAEQEAEEEQATDSILSPAPGTFDDDVALPPDILEPEPVPADSPPAPVSPDPAPESEPDTDRGRFQWVGDPRRSEAQEGDGMSDLFTVDADPDTNDRVTVDPDTDIIDADEDGSLDDLVVVTEEDVMGDELGQVPLDNGVRARQRRAAERFRRERAQRRTRRYRPGSGDDTGMGSLTDF